MNHLVTALVTALTVGTTTFAAAPAIQGYDAERSSYELAANAQDVGFDSGGGGGWGGSDSSAQPVADSGGEGGGEVNCARLGERRQGRFGQGGGSRAGTIGGVRRELMCRVAQQLGISRDDFREAREQGKRPLELLRERGISAEALREATDAALDDMVEAGSITEQQADQVRERMQQRAERMQRMCSGDARDSASSGSDDASFDDASGGGGLPV